MTQKGADRGPPGSDAGAADARPGRTLALLTIAYALNFMDRQIVAILAEPIKAEMALSDAEIGLLYGLGFAILFGLAGIPLARLSDRTRRTRIVTLCLLLFSAM